MRENTNGHCTIRQTNGVTSWGWKRVRAYIIILYCSCYIIITTGMESFISCGLVGQYDNHTHIQYYTCNICLSRTEFASVHSLYVHSQQRDFRQMSTPTSWYSRLKSNTRSLYYCCSLLESYRPTREQCFSWSTTLNHRKWLVYNLYYYYRIQILGTQFKNKVLNLRIIDSYII